MEKGTNQIAVQTPTFMDMIARAVSDPSFNPDMLDKLITANERIMAKQAEIEFNEAMARLQPKLPQIPRSTKGHNCKYATYEDVDRICRPFYTAEGFSISFDTKGQTHYGTLSHKAGHSITKQIDFSPDKSGNKSDIQAIISALSYAKRNLVQMLLNVVTAGEDNNADDSEVVLTEQAAEIDLKIKEVKADKAKFLTFMGVDDVRKIKANEYKKAMNALNSKKGKPNVAA